MSHKDAIPRSLLRGEDNSMRAVGTNLVVGLNEEEEEEGGSEAERGGGRRGGRAGGQECLE